MAGLLIFVTRISLGLCLSPGLSRGSLFDVCGAGLLVTIRPQASNPNIGLGVSRAGSFIYVFIDGSQVFKQELITSSSVAEFMLEALCM